ncbi:MULTISPECIES: STAS-like domain-containing protein [Gallibacterium]|uniref:DUF4325 domain-containing protein n=2 Tax=Gallibacterium TaxID=155493 RepID=A0A1A7PPY2_9PAST|nr:MULTISPECIES: STAS-like domain-containing protein [Gallibacterium]KGQ36959.1 hypothetical protein JP36_07575 [Gallibacterium genomosp. 1]OBX03801.1 hypothetical protein QV06_09470 [Gallibacterium genomosp. 3]WKS98505.1 STAS-like domain-containing protein [Gallibacterium salpingitidis]
MQHIYVKDFSLFPGPRHIKDGKASGEEFRNTILIPATKKDPEITLHLDGVVGYGSSFLEEAFGGAIRLGVSPNIISNIIFISEEDPDLIEEIREYINAAISELQ